MNTITLGRTNLAVMLKLKCPPRNPTFMNFPQTNNNLKHKVIWDNQVHLAETSFETDKSQVKPKRIYNIGNG